MLHYSLPNWRGPEPVSQFVEFGNGNGDVSASFCLLGYPPNHFVVNLPTMNFFIFYGTDTITIAT